MGRGTVELVDLLVLLGMGAVIPLGLTLIDEPGLIRLRRYWPLAAVPGALSLWLPRGGLATGSAALYALGTLALAAHAPVRLARTRSLAPHEIAVLTALATPSVAGLALVAERSGHELFGFDLDILALTVPHFHYAGFTAALVAGLVCRAVPDSRTARWGALSVPLGTLLVLAGYFVGDWAELVGAVVLTTGMWLVGLLTWRDLRPRARTGEGTGTGVGIDGGTGGGTGGDGRAGTGSTAQDAAGRADGDRHRTTSALLAVSGTVLAATMLLALWWALGEASGIPHPTLGWMAATHGVGNALGFALCSLLAWRRLALPHLQEHGR
ncbi:YndJ family protein [Kitasatospora sp. NBC_00458]|uniref:YndJ family protein n=1 Tax=Kitasatospora sp. NBC_00458 TaxID=2903568 RepID=UPI002E18598A